MFIHGQRGATGMEDDPMFPRTWQERSSRSETSTEMGPGWAEELQVRGLPLIPSSINLIKEERLMAIL